MRLFTRYSNLLPVAYLYILIILRPNNFIVHLMSVIVLPLIVPPLLLEELIFLELLPALGGVCIQQAYYQFNFPAYVLNLIMDVSVSAHHITLNGKKLINFKLHVSKP